MYMYIHTYLEVYATQSSGTQITHTHTHNHIHASRVGCCQALDVRNGYYRCIGAGRQKRIRERKWWEVGG